MKYTLLLNLVYSICDALDTATIQNDRETILKREMSLSIGGNNTLTNKEAVVNNCLMQYKFQELDYAFDNPQYFNFSHHFFAYKDKIRNSKVYKIIKSMPKGAALHFHDLAVMGPDYLLNITYMDNLYVCFEDGNLKMKFSHTIPDISCSKEWMLMSEARQSAENVKEFDATLRKHFTLVVDDPDKVYPSIKESWTIFLKYFVTVSQLITYQPLWEQYFYDALKLFRESNIMYVEVRSTLPELYELDGTTYAPIVTAKSYQKAINRFVKDYPDFLGAKLIYAPSRKVNSVTVSEYIELAKKIKQEMPNKFAGFDLVGPEDNGQPLIAFLPELVAAKKDLDYFFHAGETDWYGCSTDENILDAILLGTKRLGHAYALYKHPALMEEVVKKDIGIEVNVISNAVLSLVRDVRNHPLSVYIANGMPVVLSSDDPGVWEADVISDDYYVAFVGVASRLSDLRLIKQLALNSLKYSALDHEDKAKGIRNFHEKWDEFIDSFKCHNY